MEKNVVRGGFIFISIFLFHSFAISQSPLAKRPGITLGGNIIYANPKSNFKNAYQFGAGGELVAGVGMGSTYVVGSIGVVSYSARSNYKALTEVPVKIGLKKYFLLKRIFINADIGSATIKVDGESSKAFTAGYGAGVRLFGLEAAVYFNTFKNNIGYTTSGFSNNTQVKVGWSFSL